MNATADTNEPETPDAAGKPTRPALHLVSGVDDLDIPEDTQPEAPLTYRIHSGLAQGLGSLPGVWSQRQPALSEIVEYSVNGDWTIHPARRTLHLLGVILLCLPAGLLAIALAALARKPSRMLILLAALLILGYAL